MVAGALKVILSIAIVFQSVSAYGWSIEVVSKGYLGDPSYGTISSVSPYGSYVTFFSSFGNLVPGDTNNRDDVFVYDRVTGTTARVIILKNDQSVFSNQIAD